MATYAIGDVQGCDDELGLLLEKIAFNPANDRLWFVGDLVSRGPKSLAVLERLYQLQDNITLVLGNHDFHLLAVYLGAPNIHRHPTLDALLQSPRASLLCDWLLQQPLFHYDASLQCALVHAGVPWQWDIVAAEKASNEVQIILKNRPSAIEFMRHLYGNNPSTWTESLTIWDRLRYIVNAFTRMRFVDRQGALDFDSDHQLGQQASGSIPWFEYPNRLLREVPIVFGHWASLGGLTTVPNVYALDTGCVWGGSLTALRIEDKTLFHVNSHQPPRIGE